MNFELIYGFCKIQDDFSIQFANPPSVTIDVAMQNTPMNN